MKNNLFILVILFFSFSACRKEKKIDSLIGTEWRIVKYKLNKRSEITNVDLRKYNWTFLTDSTFGFNTDVNGCSGHYKYYGGNEIMVSGTSCSEVGGDHEKVDNLFYVLARGNLTNIRVNGNHLYLTGQSELVLRRCR